MKPERWRLIQEALHAALDLPPESRAEFLDAACAGDAELRAEVDELLEAHLGDPDFLDTPLLELASLDTPTGIDAPAPSHIGPYEVVRAIGEGGMGRVFLATQQTDAFTRPVAIKVVKRGMDTDEVLRRFELERRILAELTHPNIAQMYDAGATADGRPYFVMEFVEGKRIDRYADHLGLSIARRLALFQSVCAAIQHAHQKLIVHRDIKPGNVLVSEDGNPKLVDFGIGKILSETTLEGDSITRTRALRLTPEYASPEQLRGSPVTTAADVYALGVLLFELLTGQRPWQNGEADDLAGRTERVPRRPSDVAATNMVLPGPERARRSRRLRGDLDNIILKAMHPESDRRYASASALADDVGRYLTGRPVRARTDSFAYRSSKFLQRNRWSVATAMAVLLGLVGVTTTTAVQSRRVARERDKAQEVQSFLLETFGASTAEGSAGDSVTVRQLLDGQVDVVRATYQADPELRAEMLTVMADAYERLGLFEEAEALAREGLDERRLLFGAEHADVAFSLNLLGWIRHQRGASDEAADLIAESVEMWRGLGAAERAGLARALNDLGSVYDRLGRPMEAEPLLNEALAIRKETAGPLDRGVAITSSNLAVLMYQRGDYAAADSLGQQALEALRASVGPDHQRTFVAQSNLATFRWVAGELDGAADLYEDLLSRQTRLDGGRNARTASAMVTYASLLRAQGNMAEAERMLVEALGIQDEQLGPVHRDIGNTARILGIVLERQGRVEEALPLLERAVENNRAIFGEDHPQVAEALFARGVARGIAGLTAVARDDLERSGTIFAATQGDGHPRTLDARTRLGALLLESGDRTTADAVLLLAEGAATEATPADIRDRMAHLRARVDSIG